MKIHYTFDKDNQVNCLARWPQTLQIRTITLDERNSIGVIDLRTCLQAVANCSPELVGDNERDFTVYAFDYSEPDTPLVGQGMLGLALEQGPEGNAAQQPVTGRVTKNLLAIFGNGTKETLEVKLKLIPVPKVARATPALVSAPSGHATSFPPHLTHSTSTMSEAAEWNSLMQSNPHLGHTANISTVSSPAPASFRQGNEAPVSSFQGAMHPGSRPGTRPGSVDPTFHNSFAPIAPAIAPGAGNQTPVEESAPVLIAPKAGKTQSRASSRAPTGKPRGRPRKKPVEGSTSGYEDGTDAEEAAMQKKKRAKTTKVERSNTATFGSAPESLRVAASTAGSLRNFRPLGQIGDGPTGSHLQDVPRAPTPVPDHRLPGFFNAHPAPQSNLRRQSIPGAEQNTSFTSSYMEPGRSMSQSQDARSPVESAAASPYQYSEGPSPADIGSSPPVPRSTMYSVRSSPAPSSPILPPMPAPQPDSGFMSGGFEEGRLDEEGINKPGSQALPSAPVTEKAKPKPRKSRAKKPPAPKKTSPPKTSPLKKSHLAKKPQPVKGGKLTIHTETPGPPEFLPTTSLYNPPHPLPRQDSENPNTPAVTEQPAGAEQPSVAGQSNVASMPTATPKEPTPLPSVQPQPSATMSPKLEATQDDMGDLERALMDGFHDDQHLFDALNMDSHSFIPLQDFHELHDNIRPTVEKADTSMELPPMSTGNEEAAPESELPLPMVPASDPVFSQQTFLMPASEPAHPQTDMVESLDGRYNKNYVMKQAIKQKLEQAINANEIPPFCTNCGAIQTPTWRKIWRQEHKGVPAYHEYSDKPGHVTAINVLERDEGEKVIRYEMVKKTLGPHDDRCAWTEVLLCNPCGIWFAKWKSQRPPDKWDKDQERLAQVRKRKSSGEKGENAARPKKSRTKSNSQMNLTSDAYLPTDPLGPLGSAGDELVDPFASLPAGNEQRGSSANMQGPGSTHSRASTHSKTAGTPTNPIALDDDLGATRRLLFPSPRKDNEPHVLGELAVNIMQVGPAFRGSKDGEVEKENSGAISQQHDHEYADLFGTPPRPSTPPPKAVNSGPFKTPNRPTPSHRPITRSVTKSIRSVRSIKSPGQVFDMLQRTPSKTPRSPSSSGSMRRRSPRNGALPSILLDVNNVAESPFTSSINKLLSEANNFAHPSPHRGYGLDLHHWSSLDSEHFDFGNMLSTDGIMPSSPPVLRHGHMGVSFGETLSYGDGSVDIWKHLNDSGAGMNLEDVDESGNAK